MFPMKLHLQSKKIMKMFVNHFGVILLPQNEAKMMKTIFWHYLFCISKKTKLGITWKKKGGGRGEAVYYSKPDMRILFPLQITWRVHSPVFPSIFPHWDLHWTYRREFLCCSDTGNPPPCHSYKCHCVHYTDICRLKWTRDKTCGIVFSVYSFYRVVKTRGPWATSLTCENSSNQ